MAIALVKNGRVGWSKGFGLADIDAKRPVTPDTLFMLASVSKTITSVALMHLFEDPALHVSLDEDVNGRLPFPVRNPSFPDKPITLRMLLTHTSSFDGVLGLENVENTVDGDPTISLHDYVAAAVAKSASWSSAEPGTAYSYSNIAITLVGYLVEAISGISLEAYCHEAIFKPLQMNETSWFLRGLDQTHIAMPYEFTQGLFQPQGQYGVPFYPATELRTSVTQLARFLMMFAGRGQYQGARVLQAATIDEMSRAQIPAIDPNQGLVWFREPLGNVTVLGHSGGYFGVGTEMWFDSTTGSGYVLLSNGGDMLTGYSDAVVNDAWAALNKKLITLAESLH
jgi:CubicO group peptidase (beta-lactamase class C family)